MTLGGNESATPIPSVVRFDPRYKFVAPQDRPKIIVHRQSRIISNDEEYILGKSDIGIIRKRTGFTVWTVLLLEHHFG
jgi:hypothetical protein